MSNIIKISADEYKDSVLVINPGKAVEIGLGRKKQAYISFGSQKHFVDVKMSDDISEDNILLSQNIIDELHLPDYPVYETCTGKNEMVIGPFIGLLFSAEDESLTEGRLNKLMVYVRDYSKLHGAIVVFALDKVDTANRLIEGYCYNPIRDCWQRGIFPYPSSIYRVIGLSEQWKNHFLSIIGDTVFNNRYFSKWDMYEWFSSDKRINYHMPYTLKYNSDKDVLDMLERFEKVYIKPVSGMKGHGIVQVKKKANSVVFKYRENGINHELEMEDSHEIKRYIQKRFYQGKCLVQQAIDLMEYNERIVDFRCALQKNQSDMWVCNTIFGRCGDKDSIVSNISSGGTAFSAEELLKNVFPHSKESVSALIKRMESLALDACFVLDEFGINCGTLGLDIGIDKQGYLWLIEINNRDPSPQFALDINEEQLYYTIKTSPLFYAKSLAGFKR